MQTVDIKSGAVLPGKVEFEVFGAKVLMRQFSMKRSGLVVPGKQGEVYKVVGMGHLVADQIPGLEVGDFVHPEGVVYEVRQDSSKDKLYWCNAHQLTGKYTNLKQEDLNYEAQ